MNKSKIEKHEDNLRLLAKHDIPTEFLIKLRTARYDTQGLAVHTYLLRVNLEYLSEFKINLTSLRKHYTKLKKVHDIDHPVLANCREQINQLRIDINNKQIVVSRLLKILTELLT
jgi:hypothetical protein